MKSDTSSEYAMSFILPRLTNIASHAMYATEADTVGETLERIADSARELVGARYAALGIPNSAGGLRHFRFSGIDSETVGKIGRLPEGRGLLGAIIRDLRPIRLERMQDDPRSIGFPEFHPTMTSFLGVPIIIGENLYGMLYLSDKINGDPFSEEDQQVIEVIAGYAALAISGAQLRDRERRVSRLEERERIGMELHDGVIQTLYAVGMYIELIRTSEQMRADDLTQVMHDLDSVITDIRRYIQELRSGDSESQPLADCLHEVLDRLHIPPSLEVAIRDDGNSPTLPQTTYESICQMANEVISNVVRHAHARTLKIEITSAPKVMHIVFEDDGVGFDVARIENVSGLGLRNMKKRAELNRWRVEISSSKGKGTRIALAIPV
ncbi:MAG: GAF domain-containing protein [Anaerolineae bacterium]|nr:GAF domain-containing protein [Anaerolineae bacterium]NUQ03566.1 GAF domain-containing protein [Anaerolineae bacterium]